MGQDERAAPAAAGLLPQRQALLSGSAVSGRALPAAAAARGKAGGASCGEVPPAARLSGRRYSHVSEGSAPRVPRDMRPGPARYGGSIGSAVPGWGEDRALLMSGRVGSVRLGGAKGCQMRIFCDRASWIGFVLHQVKWCCLSSETQFCIYASKCIQVHQPLFF